jgi:hypothetical protein
MVCPMPDFETVEFLRREDVSPTPNPHLPQNLSAWVVLPVEFTAARRRCHPAKYSVNKVEIPLREIVLIRLLKLISSQLIKKFPAFCGTRKFITAFTSARVLNFHVSSFHQIFVCILSLAALTAA